MENKELQMRMDIAGEYAGTDEWRVIYKQDVFLFATSTNAELINNFRELKDKEGSIFKGRRMIIVAEINDRIEMSRILSNG